MAKLIPSSISTYDALTVDTEGKVIFLAAAPLSDRPGFDGYAAPVYTLTDRGTFFLPGSWKKTAREQLNKAQVLWQHFYDVPIGKHISAVEDEKGFRIGTEINMETQQGAEAMSHLRFGTPLGLSVGFDPVKDRSGTEDDDAKLDRRSAPDGLKTVPISELRAIVESRWWETSVVTWPGLGTAKPDVIHAQSEQSLDQLLEALKQGDATVDQLATIEAFVAAYSAHAAAAQTEHSTDDAEARLARIRRSALALSAVAEAVGLVEQAA